MTKCGNKVQKLNNLRPAAKKYFPNLALEQKKNLATPGLYTSISLTSPKKHQSTLLHHLPHSGHFLHIWSQTQNSNLKQKNCLMFIHLHTSNFTKGISGVFWSCTNLYLCVKKWQINFDFFLHFLYTVFQLFAFMTTVPPFTHIEQMYHLLCIKVCTKKQDREKLTHLFFLLTTTSKL